MREVVTYHQRALAVEKKWMLNLLLHCSPLSVRWWRLLLKWNQQQPVGASRHYQAYRAMGLDYGPRHPTPKRQNPALSQAAWSICLRCRLPLRSHRSEVGKPAVRTQHPHWQHASNDSERRWEYAACSNAEWLSRADPTKRLPSPMQMTALPLPPRQYCRCGQQQQQQKVLRYLERTPCARGYSTPFHHEHQVSRRLVPTWTAQYRWPRHKDQRDRNWQRPATEMPPPPIERNLHPAARHQRRLPARCSYWLA